MATFRNESFGRIVEQTLKKTAAVLRDHEIPYCLIGSLSAWVRGGPESSHDLDFGIKKEDILAAAQALQGAGMRIEVPTEDWLIKAFDQHPDGKDIMVDLIYAPSGMEIDDDVLARADYMDVLAQKMPVLCATDLMTMKLLSLREQNLNYTSTIATARSIGEQIDWNKLYERCHASPYACAFFQMAKDLGIVSEEVNSTLASMQGGDEHLHRSRGDLLRYLGENRTKAAGDQKETNLLEPNLGLPRADK